MMRLKNVTSTKGKGSNGKGGREIVLARAKVRHVQEGSGRDQVEGLEESAGQVDADAGVGTEREGLVLGLDHGRGGAPEGHDGFTAVEDLGVVAHLAELHDEVHEGLGVG